MIRRRLVALATVALAASCNKSDAATTPPPDAMAAAETESPADSGYPAAPPDAGEVGPTDSVVAPADAMPPSDTPDSGGTPDPVAPPAEEDPPVAAAKDFVLPKPINASVKASCGKDAGVGQKLKGFKLPTTEAGKTYSNGSFRGRVMLVNFWGTWCKPCLKELPKFAQLYRRYRKHGMTLLAIATDEDADAVKETLAAKKIKAKVAIAGEAYAGKYESPDFPFTFVVDHKGVIQASYFGYEPECMGKLEADIRAQLEKRAAAKQ